jgi:hypothetical protein
MELWMFVEAVDFPASCAPFANDSGVAFSPRMSTSNPSPGKPERTKAKAALPLSGQAGAAFEPKEGTKPKAAGLKGRRYEGKSDPRAVVRVSLTPAAS